MIPDKLIEVLMDENVVAIVTESANGAHVVNTWNNYIKVTGDDRLLIPVGKMNQTEENIKHNSKIQMTLGSRNVQGFHAKGTGFLINGIAEFVYAGDNFDKVKQRFPWIRAILEIKMESITQTL